VAAAIVLLAAAAFLSGEPIALGIGDFLVIRDDLRLVRVIRVLAGEDGYGKIAYHS